MLTAWGRVAASSESFNGKGTGLAKLVVLLWLLCNTMIIGIGTKAVLLLLLLPPLLLPLLLPPLLFPPPPLLLLLLAILGVPVLTRASWRCTLLRRNIPPPVVEVQEELQRGCR